MWIMWTVVPIMGKISNGRKLEQIIDRMQWRLFDECASAESWHRDIAKGRLETDITFGGWINIDKTNQYFSCIAGSHNDEKTGEGFATIKDKELIKQYNKIKTKVTVPPGHILIFYEDIIHEFTSTKIKQKEGMIRLFTGWRLTYAEESLFGDELLESSLQKQDVMLLKSGQRPPMYAKLHWTNWREKISKFSESIEPRCIHTKEVKGGKSKGEKHDVVDEYMFSLEEYGFEKYPEYNRIEKEILKPRTSWELFTPGTRIKRQKLTLE